ncbi:MAG: iron-containing redox enzyme family protein [Proteobacteria bacterium]|nr:iron-containing redox enzyme family protein [Pseudomonadota bacterium]
MYELELNVTDTFQMAKLEQWSCAVYQLEQKVQAVFASVQAWRGWKHFHDPSSPDEALIATMREVLRSVCWYQARTTEAGFHMIGRLPKSEVRLMQQLACHKAEEAEHGLWARKDYVALGGNLRELEETIAPAAFSVAAVWWWMAQNEDPYGYLGAEYLFEQLTAEVTKALLPVIQRRNLPKIGFRFVIEHATEDAKHATFLRHLIKDVAARQPESVPAMLRCFDYFAHVYPLPLWDEAFARANDWRGAIIVP